jgi:hypothetical protein
MDRPIVFYAQFTGDETVTHGVFLAPEGLTFDEAHDAIRRAEADHVIRAPGLSARASMDDCDYHRMATEVLPALGFTPVQWSKQA